MDRSLQFLFGGVASSALIAGAVAAFIAIAALVAGTDFPSGATVAPPSGSHTVRIASQPHAAGADAAPVSSRAAVRQLASVGRQLAPAQGLGDGSAAERPGRTPSTAGGKAKQLSEHAQGTSPGGSGHSTPGGGNPSTPPGSTPGTPPPGGAPPPTTGGGGSPPPSGGGGPPTGTPGAGSSGTPPGLANKPGGLPPGLASKPGGIPPGQAKAGGTPPGLTSKPGGLPPGQAKKQ